MFQIAVFVDAGYLYAQGATCLVGGPQPRTAVRLNVEATLDVVKHTASDACPSGRLLRIYWYDGLLRGGFPSHDQNLLADADLVKLRFGTVNRQGQQKGVDSLIVTDLIDLARNRAITDALLLAGDEDIRIGVQIAQTYGVQVHLLGIHPSRGSQARSLVQESDTHRVWDKATLDKFLFVDQAPVSSVAAGQPRQPGSAGASGSLAQAIEHAVADTLSIYSPEQKRRFAQQAQQSFPQQVPPELDRRTLAILRDTLSRNLDEAERMQYRRYFLQALLGATAEPE